MAKRRYSDEERANALAALAANGGDVSHTARQLGIPRTTLEKWSNGAVHPSVTQKGEEKKRDLAQQLENVAHRLVDAIPGKIKKATLQQVATSLGIAIDKMHLLRGMSTQLNPFTIQTFIGLSRNDIISPGDNSTTS